MKTKPPPGLAGKGPKISEQVILMIPTLLQHNIFPVQNSMLKVCFRMSRNFFNTECYKTAK